MSPEGKALAQVIRYARIQRVVCQRRQLSGRLFDACEDPVYHLDEFAGSGCMSSLRDAKAEGAFGYGPDDESNFWQVVNDCEFCRPCRLGLKVRNHIRCRLLKRRASLLAAMRRLGDKS